MIIAVDFDGTLCENKFPDIGRPYEETMTKLINLKRAGHKLILWTCRDGLPLMQAIAWCGAHGLTFDSVNEDVPSVKDSPFGKEKSCKVYADKYYDDKNILRAGLMRV